MASKKGDRVYGSYREFADSHGIPIKEIDVKEETPEETGKRIAKETLEEIRKVLNQ